VFAIAMILPALLYALSMSAHGWNWRYLDRPAHLIYGIPLFLVVRRIGVRPLIPLVGLAIGVIASFPLSAYQRFALGQDRAMGILSGGDFGNLAGSLAVGLALSAYCLRGAQLAKSQRLLLGTLLAASMFGFLISIWSGNRTAWVAYFVILAVCLPMLLRSLRRTTLLYALVASSMIVLFLLLPDLRHRMAIGVDEVTAYLTAPAGAKAASTSLGIRMQSIALGLDICSTHPWTGIGILEFKRLAARLAAAGAIAPEIPNFFGMLHNQFLDACVLLGIGGVLMQVAFWLLILIPEVRLVQRADSLEARALSLTLLCISLGYFVSATGGSMFGSSKGTLFLAMAWASLTATGWQRRASPTELSVNLLKAPPTLNRAPPSTSVAGATDKPPRP